MKLALIIAEKDPQGSPSLGVAYLAGYLREYFRAIEIKIFSHIPEDFSELKNFSPNVVGISAISPAFNNAINLANKIKEEMDIPVILGGPHISALPHLLPQACDVGVIGEGEETLLELIRLCENGTLTKDQLHHCRGIVFRENAEIIITARRQRIRPLDLIPLPARDLLDMEHFLQRGNTFGPHFGRGTHMFSARGCPFKCVFCSAAAFWGAPTLHSPERTVAEIEYLIEKFGVELIHIYDDLFLIDPARIAGIADLISAKGIDNQVKFGILGRVDVFNEKICKNLKKMNVVHVNFGMESGCQRVLNFLKNTSVTIPQIREAVNLAKEYGFTVDGSFIIGSPDETEEEMMETLDFIKSLNLDKFAHFILTPYPGTKLWSIAKAQGEVSDDMDWDKLWISRRHLKSIEENISVNTKMSKKRLVEIWEIFEKERIKLFDYNWQDQFIKKQ